jgi:hypothetical protein
MATRFVRYRVKPSIAALKKLGDQELLDALLDIPVLPPYYLKFILNEAPRRPAIYDDLMHLMMQHDVLHQKMLITS